MQVSKLDTLAGLAIKYDATVLSSLPCADAYLSPPQDLQLKAACMLVQVSDIKRANGLLSDNSMFARDTLIIPSGPIPVGYAPVDPLAGF